MGEKGYRIGVYEKSMPDDLTWEQKLRAAKKAGYDFIEMSIDESDFRIKRLDWTEAQIREVTDLCDTIGIRIESICLSAQRKYPLGSLIEEAGIIAEEVLKKAIRLAARMGVKIIQTQGYDCYYNETTSNRTKEKFFRNLEKGVEYAAQYGVILAMETMENDFMNTIEKAMYYVKEINSPYLQVYPDIGNITNATEYVCRDIRMGKGHIASAHLKETVPGVFREVPYGTGHVDFLSAIQTLMEQGVHRFVAEFWYKCGSNYEDMLANNLAFLERYFCKNPGVL